MTQKKYQKPQLIKIDLTTFKNPKLLKGIQKLQQMAQEERESRELGKRSSITQKLVQPQDNQE
jgi:hypothetical protein